MNDPGGSGVVRFGVFELDLRSGELRKAGVRLSLPEQPLQILECLLERPGALVNRDELRKRLWPRDTFVDFEHGVNAAVKRLRDTLGDSADSPRFIETVPRRGYRFLGPVERVGVTADASDTVESAADPDQSREGSLLAAAPIPHRRSRLAWGAGLVLAILASAAFVWAWGQFRFSAMQERPLRVVPLSTMSGWSYWPTFSPDGRQVAFMRSEGADDAGFTGARSGIYVQLVGAAVTRQLTHDANDFGPSWSPDGGRIAFVRRTSAGTRIHLISPLGGSALRLSDFPAGVTLSWSPDGRYLATQRVVGSSKEESAIWLVPLDGGSPRPLTHAKPPASHAVPAFSPDGRHLAYSACAGTGWIGCRVEVVALNGDFTATPNVVKLATETPYNITTIAWSHDGRSLVFHGDSGAVSQLFRAPADGSQAPSAIEVAGLNAGAAAWAPKGDSLAFVRMNGPYSVSRFEPGKPARDVLSSSLGDSQPALSPDGTRIAFCSARAGSVTDIWVAAADGSEAHQLTHGPNRFQCSPQWSPDGRSIAFDSQSPDGYWHLWTIDSAGGAPRQVAPARGQQNMPSWSHDGRWIYFTADQGSGRNVWRVRTNGGSPEQLTQTGSGFYALESADGLNFLYQPREYQQGEAGAPLVAMPLGGGAARELVDCVRWNSFAVSLRDTFYAACDAGVNPRVYRLGLQVERGHALGKLENLAQTPGFTVSADGTAILYTRLSSLSSDLMLIENFR